MDMEVFDCLDFAPSNKPLIETQNVQQVKGIFTWYLQS